VYYAKAAAGSMDLRSGPALQWGFFNGQHCLEYSAGALLLREPHWARRRRKMLVSPSDVTVEVVCSLLLPVSYLQSRAGEMKMSV